MRTMWTAWALMLGLALTVSAGPAGFVALTGDAGLPGTQDGEIESGVGTDDVLRRPGADVVTFGLAVRWGYLHDPAVAALEGGFRFNDDRSGGLFAGRWHVLDSRIGGFFHGRFSLPDDGRGEFRGEWNVSGRSEGGFLWGAWIRFDRGDGLFDGKWNHSDRRGGGALMGLWSVGRDDAGGGMRGRAVAAPSIHAVDWDGFLRVSDGIVELRRAVRWETGGERRFGTDDRILPRENRQTVEWLSTTTVNWDGLLFAIHVPRERPMPVVVLHTDQISFRWDASELDGLRVRERVDDFGHAIEVRGFRVDRHDCRCGDGDRDYARLSIGVRWGLLRTDGSDLQDENATRWDGFAQLTDGGLLVMRVLSFERGDGILPRDNRQTVEWRSATSGGWDGVVLLAYVPFDKVMEAHFTLHAGEFSRVFRITELPGHHVFDVGDSGDQVEVRAMRG